jgi:hypothetical protein
MRSVKVEKVFFVADLLQLQLVSRFQEGGWVLKRLCKSSRVCVLCSQNLFYYFRRSSSTVGEVNSMQILPSWRRRYLANRLLHRFLRGRSTIKSCNQHLCSPAYSHLQKGLRFSFSALVKILSKIEKNHLSFATAHSKTRKI